MYIFFRITSHPLSEGTGKAALAAEAVQLRDLGDGISAIGQKVEALLDPVVGEILGDSFSGHLLEEAAHGFPGQMDVFCQVLQQDGFLVMRMQIVQQDAKSSETFLVCREIGAKVSVLMGQDLEEDAKEQTFDLQLEAIGTPGKIVVHQMEIGTELFNPRFFGVQEDVGQMLVFQEGAEAFFLDVAAQSIVQEDGLDDDGQQDDVAVFHRLGTVGDVGVDQQDVPRRQEQLVFVNLVGDFPF